MHFEEKARQLWRNITAFATAKRIKQAVGWLALVAPMVHEFEFRKPASLQPQVTVIVVSGKI